MAGGLSKTSVAPLERIKILFQVKPQALHLFVVVKQDIHAPNFFSFCLQTGQLQGAGVGATLSQIHQHEGVVALFR